MNYLCKVILLVIVFFSYVGAQSPQLTSEGFQVAREGFKFQFPRDHGNHPVFKTEWWYLTGHLQDAQSGDQYGYQLTFFRQASPQNKWKGTRHWQSDQIYMAHAALTDERRQSFIHEERLNRGGLMANSLIGSLHVFNESWVLKQNDKNDLRKGFSLEMDVKGRQITLTLIPETPLVIFGENGVSRKGADPTAASHYLTFPRLRTEGSLVGAGGSSIKISGTSWMDHEISSNQLAPNQSGWDWAGIQLDDGRSLMFYRLRLSDGSQDPYSIIYEIDNKGRIRRSTHDFQLISHNKWTSTITRIEYPTAIELRVWNLSYQLVPIVPSQELVTQMGGNIAYWEGACRVMEGNKIIGRAYLELTGYQSPKGR